MGREPLQISPATDRHRLQAQRKMNNYKDIQTWIASEYDELELDIWKTVGMHPEIVTQAVAIQSQSQSVVNEWSPSAKLFLIKKHHELTLA